jgi:ribosomal-protein-alanine N-acetyltransferase
MENMQVILKQIGNCILRRSELGDIIPVIEINLKTLPEHYSDYFYESLLEELPEAFIVAEISGKIVGYIMCKMEHGFSNFKKLGFVKKGHVVSVAVIDEHRGKGFGSVLVNEAIKGVKIRQCSELYLEVRCSNNDAVRLYEKLGFSIIQRLKAYYRDGEDAYVMAIEITI